MAAAACSGVTPAGDLDQLGGRHEGILGVAAKHGDRGDKIAGFKPSDAGAKFLDGSRSFTAGREGNGSLVLTFAEVDFDEVDASGLDADQHLSRARMGNGQIGKLENFRSTCLGDLDGFHMRVSMNPWGAVGQGGKAEDGFRSCRPCFQTRGFARPRRQGGRGGQLCRMRDADW